jgi:6-phosphogluconolactonase (cycloisomerase 2 family)
LGSQVSVNEQSASLSPTGKVYNVQTTDFLGNFAVPSGVGTNLVEIIGNGFYMNDLTGQLSPAPIQLRAIVDLTVSANPTVNVFTSLQEQRLKTLISQGNTYAAAYAQSQTEVLAAFGINSSNVNALSTFFSMQYIGSTDADAVLVANSVILEQMATDAATANGTTQPAELSNLINTLASQIASTGKISSSTFVAARNLAETEINLSAVRTNVETYYTKYGLTIVAPKFEEWIDKSGAGIVPQRLVPVTTLAFTDVHAASPGQLITSNVYTVTGVPAGTDVPVAVSAGTTIIQNNVALLGQYSVAVDGDTLAMRVTAPGYGLSSTSTISVGSSSASWNVTSIPLSGTVSGLTGSGLVLQDNVGDTAPISPGSTTFSFPTAIANGMSYSVTVATQPSSPVEICVVMNGSGIVGSAPTNISVVCSVVPPLTGTISGLSGTGLVLQNNGGNNINIAPGSTSFSFPAAAANGMSYNVSVLMQPTSPVEICVVMNGSGTVGSAATNISVVCSVVPPLTGTISGLLGTGLVLQNNGGNNINIGPGSTSFSFPAAAANGATYNVSVLTQPTSPVQVCDVVNGSGTVGSAPTNISVKCSVTSIVFVANSASSNIGAFAVDPTTGSLVPIASSPFAVSGTPFFISVDPSGKFAYVTNPASSNVLAFTINPGTATLAPIAGSPYAIGTFPSGNPSRIAVASNDKFAYVTDLETTASVYAFSIDPTVGALAPISGSPFATDANPVGSNPVSIAITPNGSFAYVTTENPSGSIVGKIWAYTIDSTTGALTPIPGSPFDPIGGLYGPTSVTVDPTGRFAYIPNALDSYIYGFTIDQMTGALTEMVGSPFPFPPINAGWQMAVTPNGKFAYAASNAGIYAYTIDGTTGALAIIAGSPFAGPEGCIAADPTGSFVYVSGSGNISGYSINATTGALAPIVGSPFSSQGSGPSCFNIVNIP